LQATGLRRYTKKETSLEPEGQLLLSPFADSGTGSSEKRNQGSPGCPLEKGLAKAFFTGKDSVFFNREKRNASHSDECHALFKG